MANGGVLSPWSPLCRGIWPEPSLILLTSTGTPVCPWTSQKDARPSFTLPRYPRVPMDVARSRSARWPRLSASPDEPAFRLSVREPVLPSSTRRTSQRNPVQRSRTRARVGAMHAARVAASAVEANLRPCTRTLSAARSSTGSVDEPAPAYAQLPRLPRIRRPRRGQHPARHAPSSCVGTRRWRAGETTERSCAPLIRGDEADREITPQQARRCPPWVQGHGVKRRQRTQISCTSPWVRR